MAQHGVMDRNQVHHHGAAESGNEPRSGNSEGSSESVTMRTQGMSNGSSSEGTTTSASPSSNPFQGANTELLLGMMNCVDTSLFSPQQLANWEQMKLRIKQASEHKTPLHGSDVQHVQGGRHTNLLSSSTATSNSVVSVAGDMNAPSSMDQDASMEYRSPLHREASIQDVLACLLDQQPPSFRVMNSSGSSYLVNTEVKKTQTTEHKPTLKSLLSSNNFSLTEKKESLRHLLSFIDTSFASHPEPLTDVYKDCKEGNLKRLSSLQLMRTFLSSNSNSQAMGRTTSFEIIQAMLNATSNQVIQKPMTSQDSFRFQHLAHCLEAIESHVSEDHDLNEDYGAEEVVQVDNLDNLLDNMGPPTAAAPPAPTPAPTPAPSLGFVDMQTLINPSRSIYNEITAGSAYPQQYGSQSEQASNGFATQMAQPYNTTTSSNSANVMGLLNPMPSTPSTMYQTPMGNAPTIKVEQPVHPMHGVHSQAQQHQAQFSSQLQFQNMMQTQMNPSLMATTHLNTSYLNNGKTSTALPTGYNPMMMQHQAMMSHTVSSGMMNSATAAGVRGASATVSTTPAKKEGPNGVQLCSALGCNHVAKVKGMCKLHGGGRRCKVEGCMKSAQTGHLCIAHGGGKPCSVEGCPKTAQSRGLCKQHGGGVRCKFEGCTKSCQSGGFCRGHGGGKRCEYPNCSKWAQKNGHCAKHAQEVAQKLQQQQNMLRGHP